MQASCEWLRQYVEFDLEPKELAERLTAVGLPCESMEQVGNDWVLDIEVPSNRPDCLGMLGVAREVAVITGGNLEVPEASPEKGRASAASLVRVSVEDAELCSRYVARVISGVKLAPSPEWMQRRLSAVGLRPINNVVDVTNYVLLETGQPLHAFDCDLVAGGSIIVRRSRSGEKMELIDGSTVELTGSELVIADESGPVALAGVMGGARTEMHAGTANVLLESACFQPRSVRRTSRRLGVSSESSYRFERAVDWNGVEYASRRAAALIQELAGGSVASGSVDAAAEAPGPRQITVRYWRVEKLLGMRTEKLAIRRILMALGLESIYESGEGITLLAPSFRPDLAREVDLIEEVARHFGYEKVPARTKLAVNLPQRSAADEAGRRLREVLTGLGFSETVTISILSREAARAIRPWRSSRPVLITNPPRADQDTLRQSLLPSLLEVRRTNQAGGVRRVSVFDTGRAYLARPDGSVQERRMLAAMDDGPEPEVSLGRLQAALETVVGIFSGPEELRIKPSDLPYMQPGEAARVFLGKKFLGVIGRLADALRGLFDLRTRPALLELDLELLISRGLARQRMAALPRFPGIRRDAALVLDEAVTWSQVAAAAGKVPCDLRESVEFLSTYRGEQTGPGRKSVALSVTYRAPDRTLTDAEVNDLHGELVRHLVEKLEASLRE